MERSRRLSKIASWIAGYDVFISYRHADAHSYAKALEDILEAKGLMVFRDESEEDVGTPLEIFIKRACSARTLIVLATPSVFRSSNVLAEISSYLAQRIDKWYRRPFSRIISINVDQTLSNAPAKPVAWSRLSNFVYEVETSEAIATAAPSPGVVERLSRANSFMRSWRRFILVVVAVMFAILLSIVVASLYLSSVVRKLSEQRNQLSTVRQESTMLQFRIAAQGQLAQDPLIAYRLAAEAYKIRPDAYNRKLILSSLSKIDLFYRFQATGYSIEDLKEPLILLSRAGKTDEGKDFLVFEMNTLQTQPAKIKAEHAWIVPTDKTWRFITLNTIGSGLDGILTYQLWDSDGKALSDAIQSGGLSEIKFINNSKVRVPLQRSPKILVWDLVSNRKEYIDEDPGRTTRTYFSNTRSDGVSAAHFDDGLVLVDKAGNIQRESYTVVDFDPSMTGSKWSPDDQYLALLEGKRLGIWNPMKKSFVWLGANDKRRVESYSWGSKGHLLATSGRTKNDLDVTVEVVDAASPEAPRKIDYKRNAPVRSMAFVPGDEHLGISDLDGNISIVQISTGQVLKTGFQQGVTSLFSTHNAFYSSSPDSFRVWSTEPVPVRHWLFQSSKERVYSAVGAADPLWNWLAVPLLDGRIELRKISSGERRELESPVERSMSLQFSENGKWLILETIKTLRIYDSSSWNYHDFQLQQNDRQFLDLRVVGDTVYARVQGADVFTKDRYDYIVKLTDGRPTFIDRVRSVTDEVKRTDRASLLKEIDGWEFGNNYKYQSSGISSSPNSGWAHYVKCRDQALGDPDCDVQFLPTDLEKVMALHSPLFWTPTDEQLKTWLQ